MRWACTNSLIGCARAIIPIADQAVVSNQPLPVIIEATGVLQIPALAGDVKVQERVCETLQRGVADCIFPGKTPEFIIILQGNNPRLEVEVPIIEMWFLWLESGFGTGSAQCCYPSSPIMLILDLCNDGITRVKAARGVFQPHGSAQVIFGLRFAKPSCVLSDPLGRFSS